MDSDAITKIYNQLIALRNNLPEEKKVHRRYVDEYHRLLESLSKASGEQIGDFIIDDSNLEHVSGIYTPGKGWKILGDKHCERAFLLAKLDSVLLQFRSKEDNPPMGFGED